MKPPLPVRDGVSPSRQYLPAGCWRSIREFLRDHYPDVAEATWIARMLKGDLVDADGRPILPDHPYQAGSWIFYYRELEHEPNIPFEAAILFQNEHLLVADKPHFLPVTPSGGYLHQTLLVRLRKRLGLEHLTPIHRLDRETAGVILFSPNPESRGAYQSLFHKRMVAKVYEALAPSREELRQPLTYRSRMVEGEPFFRMREIEGIPNAETHIEMLERRGSIARYRLRPVTGRKHQLRLHLAALGAPILNDRLYPRFTPNEGDDYAAPLQLLAKSIEFTDPYSGRMRHFESERKLLD